MEGGRALRLRRQVHAAPLRELLAEAAPAPAPADLHSRRRLGRDLGLLRRLRLQLLLPLVHRLRPGEAVPRRLLGARRRQGEGRVALSRGVRADHLRRRNRSGGRGTLLRARPLLLQSLPARLPGVRRPARLPHHQDAQGGSPLAAHPGRARQVPDAHLEAADRRPLRHRRQPGDRPPADGRDDQGAAHRARVLPLPQRQHARLEDPAFLEALRRAGDAEAPRPLAGVAGRRPLVAEADGGPTRARAVAPASGGALMNVKRVETKRGARVRVLEAGSGAPVVFLHGAGGFLHENPFLDELATRYRVYAPELPGYGESTGEEFLEDMLDFALHGWDVVAALGLERPHLVGHSMGGMIAAEMAALAPNDLAKLVLVSAAGLDRLPPRGRSDLAAAVRAAGRAGQVGGRVRRALSQRGAGSGGAAAGGAGRAARAVDGAAVGGAAGGARRGNRELRGQGAPA